MPHPMNMESTHIIKYTANIRILIVFAKYSPVFICKYSLILQNHPYHILINTNTRFKTKIRQTNNGLPDFYIIIVIDKTIYFTDTL